MSSGGGQLLSGSGRSLGLDVGTKTIGVAVSDPTGSFAQPLLTVRRQGVRRDCARLAMTMQEYRVRCVVVGLPLELDGSEARSARLARQIGESLAGSTDARVVYVDERYTSVQAERRLIEMGMSRARRRDVIDEAAAVIILQSWLDHGRAVEEE